MKSEITPFPAAQMDLKIIKLTEVSQRQISYDITYMWTVEERYKLNLFTKQKQSHRCRKQAYGYQGGKGVRDKLGDRD